MDNRMELDSHGMTPEEALQMINPLTIRRRLGRKVWGPPYQHGECWVFDSAAGYRRIIVGYWPFEDIGWIHASMSANKATAIPTYDDMKLLHRAVFGDGHAYQLFVPADEHININASVIHLWGRADGKPALPNFGRYGTI